ncbi:MAG TPA: hypothetical protein VG839_02110 [Asticcacaulis sp.]|nr:hypothetical protein [Asticcacaulis sp.]
MHTSKTWFVAVAVLGALVTACGEMGHTGTETTTSVTTKDGAVTGVSSTSVSSSVAPDGSTSTTVSSSSSSM